jgi:hypothetical protein
MVRNMGVVEGNAAASDNDWEAVKRGGDAAIERWINGQLDGTSCAVVLIGTDTAGRKWINHEIVTAWKAKKGLVGVYIHGLKDLKGNQATQGKNPFAGFNINGVGLDSIVKAYNPPSWDSKQVYKHINDNLAAWIEEAIAIRNKY